MKTKWVAAIAAFAVAGCGLAVMLAVAKWLGDDIYDLYGQVILSMLGFAAMAPAVWIENRINRREVTDDT